MIENSLSQNSVITLTDIDHLDGRTAMALHSFCDNDPTDGEDQTMAPYVHTAVLTTIECFHYGNVTIKISQLDKFPGASIFNSISDNGVVNIFCRSSKTISI